MTPKQCPDYGINEDGKLFQRKTGEVIPDDEPVVILRASDTYAAQGLAGYALMLTAEDRDAMYERCGDFSKFTRGE